MAVQVKHFGTRAAGAPLGDPAPRDREGVAALHLLYFSSNATTCRPGICRWRSRYRRDLGG
jgi:hypothetical protein